MNSILEEFAYANIFPESPHLKQTPEYNQAMSILSINEEKLLTILNENDKIIFKKYIDSQAEVNRITSIGNFIYGYKLGLTMTAEAFTGLNNLIIEEKGY